MLQNGQSYGVAPSSGMSITCEWPVTRLEPPAIYLCPVAIVSGTGRRGSSIGTLVAEPRSGHSTRNASNGEIKLARKAGMRDANIADNPSARTATDVTTGLYVFIP